MPGDLGMLYCPPQYGYTILQNGLPILCGPPDGQTPICAVRVGDLYSLAGTVYQVQSVNLGGSVLAVVNTGSYNMATIFNAYAGTAYPDTVTMTTGQVCSLFNLAVNGTKVGNVLRGYNSLYDVTGIAPP